MKQKVLYSSLDTPAVLIDLDKLEANIREMSQLVADAGVQLRVHVKSHECASIAKMQIESGACGIEVGPVSQAEALAEEGINNIIIAHPGYYGAHKLETLKRLLKKPQTKISVVVDMIEQAMGVSQAGRAVGCKVPILIKVDLGSSSRYGLPPGKPTLDFANKLRCLPNIELKGIYSHEMVEERTVGAIDKLAFEAASMMAETAKMLRKEGIKIEHVSVGSSATFRSTCRYIKENKFPEITEIHPGQCVIGDIMYMKVFGNIRETCAVTVLTTVMSTSHSDWAIIDAGYKTFGADYLIAYHKDPGFFWREKPSFGSIQGRQDLWPGNHFAETSYIYYMTPNEKLKIGDRIEIVPNNATLVINIHDQIYGVRNGIVERVFPVTGRGKGN